MCKNIPEDIRWLIEVKVRFAGETSFSFKHFLGLGKSSFLKKMKGEKIK